MKARVKISAAAHDDECRARDPLTGASKELLQFVPASYDINLTVSEVLWDLCPDFLLFVKQNKQSESNNLPAAKTEKCHQKRGSLGGSVCLSVCLCLFVLSVGKPYLHVHVLLVSAHKYQ